MLDNFVFPVCNNTSYVRITSQAWKMNFLCKEKKNKNTTKLLKIVYVQGKKSYTTTTTTTKKRGGGGKVMATCKHPIKNKIFITYSLDM